MRQTCNTHTSLGIQVVFLVCVCASVRPITRSFPPPCCRMPLNGVEVLCDFFIAASATVQAAKDKSEKEELAKGVFPKEKKGLTFALSHLCVVCGRSCFRCLRSFCSFFCVNTLTLLPHLTFHHCMYKALASRAARHQNSAQDNNTSLHGLAPEEGLSE